MNSEKIPFRWRRVGQTRDGGGTRCTVPDFTPALTLTVNTLSGEVAVVKDPCIWVTAPILCMGGKNWTDWSYRRLVQSWIPAGKLILRRIQHIIIHLMFDASPIAQALLRDAAAAEPGYSIDSRLADNSEKKSTDRDRDEEEDTDADIYVCEGSGNQCSRTCGGWKCMYNRQTRTERGGQGTRNIRRGGELKPHCAGVNA